MKTFQYSLFRLAIFYHCIMQVFLEQNLKNNLYLVLEHTSAAFGLLSQEVNIRLLKF